MAAFVGRRLELERLGGLLRRARDHGTTAALIQGDPGSGKSRLLSEAVDQSPLCRRVRLIGFEPTQTIPLASASELLRSLVSVPVHGPRLDSLAFGTSDVVQRDPVRIFEAAHRALGELGPIVIAVDDLQWVDDLSLALLLYLLRAAASEARGLAIIAAARPNPVAAGFRTALEGALPVDHRAILDLAPLSLEEGKAFIRALDQRLAESAAVDLWRRSLGSPFWLEALTLGRDRGDVGDLIRQRLATLGGDAARLIVALAIGGRPFPTEQLGWLLDWEPSRLAAAVRELSSRGLAMESGGSVRTAHDLIREAAARDVPSDVRLRMHDRYAEVIEHEAGDDLGLLREALEHRAAAGRPSVDLALRLASSPQRRLLGRDGLLVLAAIADSVAPGSDAQCDLDSRLGEIASALGEQDLAIERWSRVADHAAEPGRRRRAILEAGWAAYHRQDAATAHAFAERARGVRAVAAESGEVSEAIEDLEASIRLSTLEADVALWLDHHTADGAIAAERAVSAARRMAELSGGMQALSPTQRAAYIAALDAAMDAALQQDRGDDVVHLGQESLEIAHGAQPEAYLAALNRVGFALRPSGRVVDSERRYREAWELSQRLVLPTATVDAGHGLAFALGLLGRPREAREIAAATLEVEARLTNAPRRWGHAAAILHEIELSLGDPGAALRALREDAAHETDPHFRLGIHQTIATWEARARGERAKAVVEEHLVAARADWDQVGCPRCGRELTLRTVELLARVGLASAARQDLTAWDARLPNAEQRSHRWRQHAEAMVLAAEGHRAEALTLLQAIAAQRDAGSLLDDELWIRIDIGRLLETDDRAKAIAAYQEAAALADRTGAETQARLIAQSLRRLGVRAWRRGGAVHEDALSDREAEVARLVALGASNREIAETLLIAPKTVERHVSNALTKLGLRNRTELAAWLGRRAEVGASVRVSPDDRRPAPH